MSSKDVHTVDFAETGTEEALVAVTFAIGDKMVRTHYLGCYAFHSGQQVIVRSYADKSSHRPRAVYPAATCYIEHFGPHPEPTPPKTQGHPSWKASQVLDGIPVKVKAEKEAEAKANFDKHLETFQETVPEQQPLSSDPKDDAGPSTEADAGSDPNILETPSGKFALRVPLDPDKMGFQEHKLARPIPAEEVVAVMFEMPLETQPEEVERRKEAATQSSTEFRRIVADTPVGPFTPGPEMLPDVELNEAERRRLALTDTAKPLRTGGKKPHGSHGRPRQLPGATALIALALFLSLPFRRS